MQKIEKFDVIAVAELLISDKLGVIPTDTVYGLAVKASSRTAVKRLYDLKDRRDKPGTVIAFDVNQLESLGLKRRYLKVVEQYWPGPVSVIIPCRDELDYLHLGMGGLAVRIPDDKKLLSLLEKTGPLLSSSANLTKSPPASNIQTAETYFSDRVDFYVDGGDLAGRLPSTIIRVVDDVVEVLRQGTVVIESDSGEIRKVT
jgi:tRNA threonylcarbamoyl adenosine modification protein (Sua5/YciO/YrdC/YwlC family)